MPDRKSKRSPARRKPASVAALLTVDVGNSDTVVGLFRGKELAGVWRVSSVARTADELMLQLDALLRRATGAPKPGGAVLCSVVPSLTPAWSEAIARVTGGPPLEVYPAEDLSKWPERLRTKMERKAKPKSAAGAAPASLDSAS